MYKVLIRIEGAWREIETSYNRKEIEDYAATELDDIEYMVVDVIRHHSGEPEEFKIKQ